MGWWADGERGSVEWAVDRAVDRTVEWVARTLRSSHKGGSGWATSSATTTDDDDDGDDDDAEAEEEHAAGGELAMRVASIRRIQATPRR